MSIKPLEGKASRSVHLATARYNVYEGAVRSGKTIASIFCWLEYIRHGPKGNLAMLGKTERTLKRNVIDPIIEMLGPKRARYLAGAGEFHVLGRRIYTAGANNITAVQKIQGLTLAGAYGDEVSTWPKELMEMLGTRLSIPGAQFFGTCNPEGPVHWFLSDWLSRAAMWVMHDGSTSTHTPDDAIDLHRFSFTLDDNPHLSPEFVAGLRAQYRGLFFKRYILGLWVPAEGAIYDMFDTDKHVVSELPLITRWLSLGVDHGTRNPFHAGLLGLGTDRKLHLTREWRWDSMKQRQQLSNAEYSRRMREWLTTVPVPQTALVGVRPERVIVDPSAADFRVQLHNDGMPSIVADNEVLPGIRTIQSLLALDLLDIHESAHDLVTELQGYSWDDKAAEKGEDEPLKVADHGCLIAGTLVQTNAGPKPIEAVAPGDRVLTREGMKLVIASGMTSPSATVYRVETSDGRTLTGTGNHPVWVKGHGWKRLDALRYADKLVGARVLRVTAMPEKRAVWNLTVADCPEYFASGILVHNCDMLRYAAHSTRSMWRPDLRHVLHLN